MFFGCTTPTGNDSSTSTNSVTTTPKNGTTVTTIVERIGPKMGLKTISTPAGSMRSIRGTPTNTDFILSNDFDPSHRLDVNYKDWDATKIQLSSPIFDGFEYIRCSDGDTYTSEAFGRKVTTVVSVTDGKITYHGNYNDGGGYYNLVINNDGTYAFEQYIIFDVLFLNPDYGFSDPNYIRELHRYASFGSSSGKITISKKGVLTSEGSGDSYFIDYMAGSRGGGTEMAYSAHDIESCFSNFWANVDGHHTSFLTRSSPGYFVTKNAIEDRYFEIMLSLSGYAWYTVNSHNVTYTDANLKNITHTFLDHVTPDMYQTGYYQAPKNNWVAYRLNGNWTTLFNLGYDMGMGERPVLNDKSVLTEKWNYTDAESIKAIENAYDAAEAAAVVPVVTTTSNDDGTTTTTTTTTEITDNGDGTITTKTTVDTVTA
jgi:hypothetical protein